MKAIELAGRVFGRLTVSARRGKYCDVVCLCGRTKEVPARDLLRGGTRSCGCLMAEARILNSITHGDSSGGRTPEYQAWKNMKARCYNQKRKEYPRYGGRGILVCDRWMNDYAAFLSDMGRRPSPRHSIERKDNSKGYSPDNCVWGTPSDQAKNRDFTIRVSIDGVDMCLADACRARNVTYTAVIRRVRKDGMDPLEAIAAFRGFRKKRKP